MNKRRSLGWAFALIGIASATAAGTQSTPSTNPKGQLVSSSGLALYTYDPDGTSGRSQCFGPCAALWPPYAAGMDAKPSGDFAVIRRPDGSAQWAFKGRPLYLYAGDAKPGFADGDGMNGVWHVAHSP